MTTFAFRSATFFPNSLFLQDTVKTPILLSKNRSACQVIVLMFRLILGDNHYVIETFPKV